MRILVTGASGQLGRSLQATAAAATELMAVTHTQLDITRERAVARIFDDFQPQLVVNAAAYTAVDKAESDQEKAFEVNALGPEILAAAAVRKDVRFMHISTDFVFDGLKSSPYQVLDVRHPLGVYAASKAEGEQRVLGKVGSRAVIIRSGWVYAAHGHNFVNTILRLLQEKSNLKVISDQVGTPTWAISLANFVWAVVERPEIAGVLHWSDAGVASWYDFAIAIQEEAQSLGLIHNTIPIHPVTANEYPLPAKRPPYSVLDKQLSTRLTGMEPCHWRINLRKMLKELGHA